MSIKKFCVITLKVIVAVAGLYMIFWSMTSVNAGEAQSVCTMGIESNDSKERQYLDVACLEVTRSAKALKGQYGDEVVKILVLQHMAFIERAINQPHIRHHLYFGIPGDFIPTDTVEEIQVGVRELLVDDPSGLPLPRKLTVYDTITEKLTQYP